MKVEIWSDVICPWCYIGKRRFEAALAAFPQREQVQVVWRSFELDPNAPRQQSGTLEEMLAEKYRISLHRAAAMNTRVAEIAREVGLDYRLSHARPGNTFDAHRLLHYADSRKTAALGTERIMHGYFSEGLQVGDRGALARLAPDFGIPENDALAMLESDAYADEVRRDEARAAEFEVTGVPFFLFDEKIAITGAQSVETLSDALQQTLAES